MIAALAIIAAAVILVNFRILFFRKNVLQSTLQKRKTESARVERVIDGDTFTIKIGGVIESVRLIGVNTPEVGERGYVEAKAIAKGLLDGQIVKMEPDKANRDRYGRLLRYVWVNGKFVNRELVRLGVAQVEQVEPNIKRIKEIEK